MSDVSIQIDAQTGDISGLQKIEAGYTSVLTKARQLFQEISSPITALADRSKQARGLEDLSRKATEIEQKLARTRLDQLQGVAGPITGPGYMQSLKDDLEATNIQRQMGQQAMARPQMGGFGQRALRMGRFAGGKALRYGGAIAGIAGAYSLFSGIAENMGFAKQSEEDYAMALSQGRGMIGGDFGGKGGFFAIREILNDLGDVALATSKDMLPLLGTAKELGNLSGGKGGFTGQFAGTVNLAKMLGVDTATLNQLFQGGIRGGGFGDTEQMRLMSQGLMLNPAMRFRGTEAIQSFQQMMEGNVGGTQQLGGFGMFNLMNTLNASPFLAYRGAGGAQRMSGINQAFTQGGNENMQYFQAMALSPAFQSANNRRLAAYNATQGGPTDFGSGRYDQIIADVFQELGAFATAGDVQKQLSSLGFTGAAKYVGEQYKGNMGKMGIQNLFERYQTAYGKGEGNELLMTAQMAKDMGVSFADVGVLRKSFQDPEFIRLAKEGKLDPKEMAGAYGAFESKGAEGMTAYLSTKRKSDQAMQKMAEHIQTMVTDLLPALIPALETMAEYLPVFTKNIVKVADFIFGGTPETDQSTQKRATIQAAIEITREPSVFSEHKRRLEKQNILYPVSDAQRAAAIASEEMYRGAGPQGENAVGVLKQILKKIETPTLNQGEVELE